jgi:putative transposase
MMMNKRTFTVEEKLRIIKEASEQGVKVILEKYGLYPTTFYFWKNKLEEMGEPGLQHGMTPRHLKRIRELEKENYALKQLLAEKELEGKLKDDLLKKKYALEKKRR